MGGQCEVHDTFKQQLVTITEAIAKLADVNGDIRVVMTKVSFIEQMVKDDIRAHGMIFTKIRELELEINKIRLQLTGVVSREKSAGDLDREWRMTFRNPIVVALAACLITGAIVYFTK